MYHFIVRQIMRRAYRCLSAGDYATPLKQFAPDIVFRFAGDHAMGGEQHGIAAVRQWFQRLYRLFPGIQFELVAIPVSGWPWNTTVTTHFRVRAALPGGRTYANEGMQFLRLRWGRAVEDYLYEDTQHLVATLHYLAQQGVAEALAPPLAGSTAPAPERVRPR